MPFEGYQPQFKFKKYKRWIFSYTFESRRNGSIYVIEALYYEKIALFIIKFYDKNHSGKNKYAVLTNQGDIRNILMTNFNLLKILLHQYPTASFCFMGERRYYRDKERGELLVKDAENNVRYGVYKLFVQQEKIQYYLNAHFVQKYKDSISGYLFLNRNNKLYASLSLYEDNIRDMLGNEFLEIRFLG